MDELTKIYVESVGDPALALGSDLIASYVKKISNFYPWISVGSSDGAVEYVVGKKAGVDFICIDPDPLLYSFNQTIHVKPSYQRVNNLILDHPELKNNCNLLIVRSYPAALDEIEKAYDIDAIVKLLPVNILIVCELNDSPSEALHIWMNNPTPNYYKVCHTECHFIGFHGNPILDECRWISRETARHWKECPKIVKLSREKIIAHSL